MDSDLVSHGLLQEQIDVSALSLKLNKDFSSLAEVDPTATDILAINQGSDVKRTSFAKFLDWIRAQTITWTAKQYFNQDIGIGTITPNYAGYVRAVTVEGTTQALYELASTRADGTGPGLGGIEWNWRTQVAGHQQMARIMVSHSGSTANQRGAIMRLQTKADGLAGLNNVLNLTEGGNAGINCDGPLTAATSHNTSRRYLALRGIGTTAGTGYGVVQFQTNASDAISNGLGNIEWMSNAGVRLGYLTAIYKTASGLEIRISANNTTTHFALKENGNLDLTGFVKLGDTSPAIKQKKLTGTSGAAGATIGIAHGLTHSKILAINVLINDTNNNLIPPSFADPLYRYDVYTNTNNVQIAVASGATGVASRAITVLITYEE